MTRQLCKLIIGTDELAKMNITQTKGREQMPNKPLEAIFGEPMCYDIAQFFYVCAKIYRSYFSC